MSDSEQSALADDAPPAKMAKVSKPDLYKPPTNEELTQLRETENLFQSSLFRMQVSSYNVWSIADINLNKEIATSWNIYRTGCCLTWSGSQAMHEYIMGYWLAQGWVQIWWIESNTNTFCFVQINTNTASNFQFK